MAYATRKEKHIEIISQQKAGQKAAESFCKTSRPENENTLIQRAFFSSAYQRGKEASVTVALLWHRDAAQAPDWNEVFS